MYKHFPLTTKNSRAIVDDSKMFRSKRRRLRCGRQSAGGSPKLCGQDFPGLRADNKWLVHGRGKWRTLTPHSAKSNSLVVSSVLVDVCMLEARTVVALVRHSSSIEYKAMLDGDYLSCRGLVLLQSLPPNPRTFFLFRAVGVPGTWAFSIIPKTDS